MSLSASKAQVTPQLSSHTTRVELLPSDMQLILCFLQTKCVTTALSSKWIKYSALKEQNVE